MEYNCHKAKQGIKAFQLTLTSISEALVEGTNANDVAKMDGALWDRIWY